MKKIVILYILTQSFMLGSQNLINFNKTELEALDFDKKLWNDNQVYYFAERFQIQDSFFINSFHIKPQYTFLLYMPEESLGNYFKSEIKMWKSEKEFRLYQSEIKGISEIDEWVSLIQKYPEIANIYLKFPDVGNGTISGFNEFLRKLKAREMLMFIGEYGSTIIVNNTRDNYN